MHKGCDLLVGCCQRQDSIQYSTITPTRYRAATGLRDSIHTGEIQRHYSSSVIIPTGRMTAVYLQVCWNHAAERHALHPGPDPDVNLTGFDGVRHVSNGL